MAICSSIIPGNISFDIYPKFRRKASQNAMKEVIAFNREDSYTA